MVSINALSARIKRTFEGATAVQNLSPIAQLRRTVLSCLLWEDEFYEDGVQVADRLSEYASRVTIEELSALAIEARHEAHLRHVPLLLLVTLIERGRGNPVVAQTIERVISRADEPGELLAIYWRKGKRPLSAQLKKGLAAALRKFDAYELAKYDRQHAVRLRDVLFLTHAKPKDEEQAATWRALVDGTLPSANTWEAALSSGENKRLAWERLIRGGALGYLALLRNLRNMVAAGVDDTLLRNAILARKGAQRVLPFSFVAAARQCPQYEAVLDEALSGALDGMTPLPGTTIVLVDVSGSMLEPLSAKSWIKRVDAAAVLASIIPGVVRVFTVSEQIKEVPPRRGMAGVDVVLASQGHGRTMLGKAMDAIRQFAHDRVIVITDEQSHDFVHPPVVSRAYMINVASATNGVGYGRPWVHIDGLSENTLRFIEAHESGRAT